MSVFSLIKHRFFPSRQARRVKSWFQVNGDRTLRWDYELGEDSMVFDLGGYEGQWASDIFSKYRCRIWVFEPLQAYAEKIQKRFEKNNKIRVFPIGLGKEDAGTVLYEGNDGTSLYRGGKAHEIRIQKASDFFREQGISKIDLMKINIEGGEYDLLEELIENRLVENITDIQVQFHDFVPDAEARMKRIQGRLAETHRPTYQYEFVWENWTLKKPS